MVSYAERRADAISMAANYALWGMPPTPEGNRFPPRFLPLGLALRVSSARYIGRMSKPKDGGWVRVDWNARTHAYFEAKEKNQNRDKFND